MYEQLNSNKAKRVLTILEAGSSNSNLLGTFKAQASGLNSRQHYNGYEIYFLFNLFSHFLNFYNYWYLYVIFV